jgi:hypothetical protein
MEFPLQCTFTRVGPISLKRFIISNQRVPSSRLSPISPTPKSACPLPGRPLVAARRVVFAAREVRPEFVGGGGVDEANAGAAAQACRVAPVGRLHAAPAPTHVAVSPPAATL